MFEQLVTGRTLVVGDGNLTFSAAMAHIQARCSRTVNLVASVLESRDEWMKKFDAFHSTLAQLESLGVEVLFSLDITKIDGLASLGQTELFDFVIFNFPHPPGKSNLRASRLLLTSFFLHSRPLLSADGKVAVTLLDSQCENEGILGLPTLWTDEPPLHKKDSWRPLYCASSCGFILYGLSSFPLETLSQFNYRNTGFRGQAKAFSRADKASTLWFRQAPFADLSSSADEDLAVAPLYPFFCLDMSFWSRLSLDQGFLRDEIFRFTNNLVKSVRLVEIYQAPIVDGGERSMEEQKQRASFCIRLCWQSHTCALTKELAVGFHEQLKVHLIEWSRINMIPFQLRDALSCDFEVKLPLFSIFHQNRSWPTRVSSLFGNALYLEVVPNSRNRYFPWKEVYAFVWWGEQLDI